MSFLALAESKRYLRVGQSDDDALIQSLIDGVEQWFSAKFSTGLTQATQTDQLDGGGTSLRPYRQPVASVTSITDLVTSNVESSDVYALRADSEVIRDDGSRWALGRGRWSVIYVGGYATLAAIPASVKNVLLSLLFRAYNNRGGMTSESSEGYSVNWQALMSSDMMAQVSDQSGSIF